MLLDAEEGNWMMGIQHRDVSDIHQRWDTNEPSLRQPYGGVTALRLPTIAVFLFQRSTDGDLVFTNLLSGLFIVVGPNIDPVFGPLGPLCRRSCVLQCVHITAVFYFCISGTQSRLPGSLFILF